MFNVQCSTFNVLFLSLTQEIDVGCYVLIIRAAAHQWVALIV